MGQLTDRISSFLESVGPFIEGLSEKNIIRRLWMRWDADIPIARAAWQDRIDEDLRQLAASSDAYLRLLSEETARGLDTKH